MYPLMRPWMAPEPLSTERREALYQILRAACIAPPGPFMFINLLGGLRTTEHLGLLKPGLRSSSFLFGSGGEAYELMAQCYAPSTGYQLAASFLEDLTKELRYQCTTPLDLASKPSDYLNVKYHSHVLSIIDPLVEQVQQEMVNHLCWFSNFKQIHDILLIIELIAYQKRKLLSLEIIFSLEDIQIMSDCLFHFVMEAFSDFHGSKSAASRKQELSQVIKRPTMDNARAPAIPRATFSSTSSYVFPPYPRSVPVPSSQAPQPLGASDPLPNDPFPNSHLPRGFQVHTEPQSTLHTENLSCSSQQSTPCQNMAEALKRYTETNTATKAECLGALTKQEESRQQLQFAFEEFLHSEAVLHDQAEQTISALFDAAGPTNDHATSPRSPGNTSAAPPSFSPGAPPGSRPANAQGRWSSSAILPESLSPGYAPPVMYPQFAPFHPSPPNNGNFMNPPALSPNPYSYSPYPVPPPLGNLFTPPNYPNTTGSFQTLSPYAAWPMSMGPGPYYGSTFSAPQTFRGVQPYGGASASFGTSPRWQNKEPHYSTSDWKAPTIPPPIPNATSHTARYANVAAQHRFVPPTGSSACDTSSPYYPFCNVIDGIKRSPGTHPAAFFTPPPPPPVPRVPDSPGNSRSTSPYSHLPDLWSYVMPPLESSSDIPGLRQEFSDDGTPRREPLSPITERTSQGDSEAGNSKEHRAPIIELTSSPYLPRAPEAPGHSVNARGNRTLRTTSPSVSSPIYVLPELPTPHANTPPHPCRVEVDSSVSELVTDSSPSVLSSPTSDNALFREAERGGWYFPASPPDSPLVINSVPVTVLPSPGPQNCGSTPISVSPPPGVRDYETTDMSRSTSSPIASSASNPLPPSQLSTQLQFSHLFSDDNRNHPPPPGAIIPPPLPPSSSERIEKVKGRFDGLKQSFSFPRFVDVSMDGSTSKTVDTTALYATTLMECALNNGNHPSMLTGKRYRMLPFGSEGGRRVHRYSKDLDDVLLELDGVWCGDDAAAKAKRKEVVDEVVKEANVLDQWKDMICKMADVQQ